MPSKQNEADVLAVEELVHEIRENLRLKARPSHHPNRSRPSPYHIPCRSWSEPSPHNPTATDKQQTTHPIIKKKPAPEDTIDDPYELLQQLIKNNNLVKEAVRRLQHNFSSPKQRYFYESDEESHSPIVMMCQLES
ncbi:GSK-3-binding protein-like [Culicoides brevitarsis]|uniref:GSK-3-binding protein-like n=1 Tax=Culicoides brevitarsis TaxID=469753 RepID=UPI00307C8136